MTTAIETEYAGHRFRSRLEARWAVFFDHLGVKWLYEPQGYELGNGERYLPDFWLPEERWWVEVKGVMTDDDAWRLYQAADLTGLPVAHETEKRPADIIPPEEADRWAHSGAIGRILLLGEVPMPAPGAGWLHPSLILTGGRVTDQTVFLLPASGRLQAMALGWPANGISLRERSPNGVGCPFVTASGRLLDAYGAARKARFEHGESGYLKPALSDSGWGHPVSNEGWV